MIDQAAKLREIATDCRYLTDVPAKPHTGQRRARVIAVSSGKGGVGKTNIAVNLALKLQDTGSRILLVDADYNLSNADIIMGISPQFNLSDAVLKHYSIKEVIHSGPNDLHILPGCSGFAELIDIPENKRVRIFKELGELEYKYDYIIIDTAAGLNKQVLDILSFSQHNLMVITPEPTSIADTYAVIKVLSYSKKDLKANLIVNQVSSYEQAKDIYNKVKLVIDKFLDVSVRFSGYIVNDNNIKKAVMRQNPFVLEYPKTSGSKCVDMIVDQIVSKGRIPIPKEEGTFFEKISKISLFN